MNHRNLRLAVPQRVLCMRFSPAICLEQGDSAALLAGHLPVRIDAVFNEADIAIAPFSFSLRPGLWTAAGRLIWLAGAGAQESYSVAKLGPREPLRPCLPRPRSEASSLLGTGG